MPRFLIRSAASPTMSVGALVLPEAMVGKIGAYAQALEPLQPFVDDRLWARAPMRSGRC
jgi:hypothetical protein